MERIGQYMKNDLISKFAEWLKTYSSVELMRRHDFAEYEINTLLQREVPGEIIFRDENTFTARYGYTFSILTKYSIDNKLHAFAFMLKSLV